MTDPASSGAFKALRRQDVRFANKEQSLRDDVRTLGTMVGDLIREQGGEDLFDFVETARQRSIRRREENEVPGEELARLVATERAAERRAQHGSNGGTGGTA